MREKCAEIEPKRNPRGTGIFVSYIFFLSFFTQFMFTYKHFVWLVSFIRPFIEGELFKIVVANENLNC